MENFDAEFVRLVTGILRRYCVQNGRPAPDDAEFAAVARRLRSVVAARGLPPPLPPGEQGAPGELPEPECDALVAEVLKDATPAAGEIIAAPARQLVKACFYPEFKICRDSFREVSPDGSCRRQQLARARQRVSGAHCVDCPYWVSLTPEQHGKFLARNWRPEGRVEFEENRSVFLPEDFRALRRLLHAAARFRIQA